MYKVTIKTKYNVIVLNVEDAYSNDMKELYEQIYVQDVHIEYLDCNIEKPNQMTLKK